MAEPMKGQVAIVTGASRGIGFAIAQALAAEDIAVALVARSEAAVRAASETIHTTWRESWSAATKFDAMGNTLFA